MPARQRANTAKGPAARRPSLDGAVAKLERAAEHIKALEAEIDREPPVVRLRQKCELDVKAERLGVAAEILEVPAFPTRWSTIIGDALQNTRIALEYLVYELIRIETGCYWEGSQFPIATDPNAHTRTGQKTIAKLGPHWAVIEPYQPYDRGVGTSLGTMAFRYLQTFSNQDKHRLLVPVASTLEPLPSAFVIHPINDCRRPRMAGVWVNAGVLQPGADLLRESFLVTGPDPRAGVAKTYKPLVSFSDPDLATMGAAEVLLMIYGKAAKLVSEFEQLF